MAPARRTRITLWILLAIFVAGVLGIVYLLTVPPPFESWIEGRVQVALREHYGSNVRLQNLHATLIPIFTVSADNFVLPNRGGGELPPLITVKHIEVEAAPFELLRSPVHLSRVVLTGLEIRVPPKGERSTQAPGLPPGARPVSKSKEHTRLANFVIDRVQADGTELYVLRKDPRREPLNFELRKLSLRGAGPGQPMTFTSELTNPTPPGLIETKGSFGPWNFDQPSSTRVSGHYTFQHADLSVFNGISGILSSAGDYQGVLHNIVVDGATDTPDFKLDSGGKAVHLTTQFHAIVDGTNGNTYLQPVKAHFLKSDVVTTGAVSSKPGEKGKTVALDVDIEQARVQDVLALASKSEPAVLTGGLSVKASVVVPPGKERVLRKMTVNGRFDVADARFNDEKLRHAVAELSKRGQGKPDADITDVPADFAGDFYLAQENLSFRQLQFVVPGAVAQVKGSYAIPSETIDFEGDVKMNATLSQMMGGKHWWLVPFDPLFMKHGAGTYLPFKITGTRSHPDVNVDWKKLF